MSNEEDAMAAGDSSLEALVQAEEARIDAILELADADKDSFSEIVSFINSVDTENDQDLADAQSSIDTRMSGEEATRAAADASLTTRLSTRRSRSLRC